MDFPTQLIQPTLISLGIGILFYAILYMLSNVFQRKELKGLATESFADLSTAFVYVFLAIFFFSLIHNVTPGMLGIDLTSITDPDKTGFKINYDNLYTASAVNNVQDLPLIYVGEAYLSVMYYQGEKLYRSMLLQIGYMSLLSSIEIGASSNDNITPFKGFDPFLNFAPTMLTSASIMLMTFSAQLFLLKFFVSLVPTVFFPLGILFRVLYPTRSFGGGLIALSFTMYFIYPLVLSYNFAIMVNVLGVDNLQLDSILYNAPTCTTNAECNSNSCVGTGDVKYCKPCILTGKIPDGASQDLCCSKVSKLDVDDNECVLKLPGDLSDDEALEEVGGNFGKGGIITEPKSVQNLLLIGIFVTIIFIILMKVLVTFGILSGVVGFFTGLLGLAFGTITTVLSGTALTVILHPITMFIVLLIYNSKYFFLGFILPAVQFIILVEFVRVLTGSMGESIDIMDLFKVI